MINAMKMMADAMEYAYLHYEEEDFKWEVLLQALAAGRAAIEAVEKVEPDAVVVDLQSCFPSCAVAPVFPVGTEFYLHPPSAEIRKDAEQPKVAATRDEFLFWFNVTFHGSGVDEYWAYDMCQQWAKYAAMQEKQP